LLRYKVKEEQGGKKYRQNFDGEISWKEVTEKKIKDTIYEYVDLLELVFEDGRLMEIIQRCVH
jgi:hypothetical protein